MDQFHRQQDGLSDWINVRCSSVLFTRNTPNHMATVHVHWETTAKMFPEGLFLLETKKKIK